MAAFTKMDAKLKDNLEYGITFGIVWGFVFVLAENINILFFNKSLFLPVADQILIFLESTATNLFVGALIGVFVGAIGYVFHRKKELDKEKLLAIYNAAVLAMFIFLYSGVYFTKYVLGGLGKFGSASVFYSNGTLVLISIGLFFVFYKISFSVFKAHPEKKWDIKKLIWAIAILLIIFTAVGHFALTKNDKIASPNNQNIILITVDTARADHLGIYGYDRDTSPNIDRLATQGTMFKYNFAAAPSTTPSHATIMTGLYPQTHGVTASGYKIGNIDTIASLLSKEGYETAAFASASTVKSYITNLDRGFDVYNERFYLLEGFTLQPIVRTVLDKTGIIYNQANERRADEVNKAAFLWLEKNKDKRFFAWIHYFDPHAPYNPPAPYDSLYTSKNYKGNLNKDDTLDFEIETIKNKVKISREDHDYIVDLYDGEIKYTDYHIGLLLKKLDELKLTDKTTIILVADHGEEFGEHDETYYWHGKYVYDTSMRVPFIIKGPEIPAGKVIDRDVVENIDIAPTIFDYLGIKTNTNFEGTDLMPLVKDPDTPIKYEAYLLADTEASNASAIRTLENKYIYTPHSKDNKENEEFYNMISDPVELSNIISSNDTNTILLKEKLFKWIASHAEIAKQQLDPEIIKTLKALGYLS